MPDGKMRLFGPYGKLVNCVRANDSVQTWAEFVNRDTWARVAWCNSQHFLGVPLTSSQSFVDEVNRQMKNRCD